MLDLCLNAVHVLKQNLFEKYYAENDANIDVLNAYTLFACTLSQVFIFVRENTFDTETGKAQ